jgi:hypothetical protein
MHVLCGRQDCVRDAPFILALTLCSRTIPRSTLVRAIAQGQANHSAPGGLLFVETARATAESGPFLNRIVTAFLLPASPREAICQILLLACHVTF